MKSSTKPVVKKPVSETFKLKILIGRSRRQRARVLRGRSPINFSTFGYKG